MLAIVSNITLKFDLCPARRNEINGSSKAVHQGVADVEDDSARWERHIARLERALRREPIHNAGHSSPCYDS